MYTASGELSPVAAPVRDGAFGQVEHATEMLAGRLAIEDEKVLSGLDDLHRAPEKCRAALAEADAPADEIEKGIVIRFLPIDAERGV
jgi:hypothetical protein